MPDVVVRLLALVDPEVRSVVGELGHKTTFSLENAKRRVAWTPRPAQETVIDCARSLLAQSAPGAR